MTVGPDKTPARPAAEPQTAVKAEGPGRPRDLRRRAAVITATREQLTSRGYDDITLSGIARPAGVSRPFVYEHWGTKFALVEEAIFTTPDEYVPVDDDVPFAEALTNLVTAMVQVQSDSAYLAGLPGVAAELYNRADLVEKLESRYIAPIRAVYVRLIERGKAQGLVRPDVDGSALLDTVRGAVMLHTLINTALEPKDLVEHLCSLILHGITVTSS